MYRPQRVNKPRRVIHSIDELPVLCDCAEAGLLLRRNPEVIAKMAKEGVLKGAKQGQSWFFAGMTWWSIWTSCFAEGRCDGINTVVQILRETPHIF